MVDTGDDDQPAVRDGVGHRLRLLLGHEAVVRREEPLRRPQQERRCRDPVVPGPEPRALEVPGLFLDGVLRDLGPYAAPRSRLDVVREVAREVVVPAALEHRQALDDRQEHLDRGELDTEPVHGGSDRVEHLGAHVEPSVEQDELGHAIRVVRCEAHPDVGPERMAHDDGAIEIEMVQEPEEIGGVLGQAVPFGGLLAVTTTAQVVRDESVAAAQDVGDRVPGGVVGREPMDRDDRRPTARPFVDRQADSIYVQPSGRLRARRSRSHTVTRPSTCPAGSACTAA